MNLSNKIRQGCWVTHRDFGRGHVIGYGSTRGALAIQFDDHQVTHVLSESTLTLTTTPPSARVAPTAVKPQTHVNQQQMKPTTFKGGRPVPAKKTDAPAPAAKPAPAPKPAAKPAAAKKEKEAPAEKTKSVAQELRAKLKNADTATAIAEARAAGVLPSELPALDQFLAEFMEAGVSADYPWLRKRFIAALVDRAK